MTSEVIVDMLTRKRRALRLGRYDDDANINANGYSGVARGVKKR